jgi:hypothetical protein
LSLGEKKCEQWLSFEFSTYLELLNKPVFLVNHEGLLLVCVTAMECILTTWVEEVGVSEHGIKSLQKAEFTDLKALLLIDLAELEKDSLKLTVGDKAS